MTRHPLDLFSLVAGVLVAGTAVVLLLPGLGPETLGRLTPVAIIALGLAVLASARPARDATSPGETAPPGASGNTTLREAAPRDDAVGDAPRDGAAPNDARHDDAKHDDTARIDSVADDTRRL